SGALVLVNPDGTGIVRLARTNAADTIIGAAWSPDGKLIAYSKFGAGDADIYVIAPDASGQREITFSRGNDVDPTWSGDGSRIACETNRNGNSDIYSVAADGSDAKQLTSSPQNELDPAWSPDGSSIAYTVESADHSTRQLWVMSSDGSNPKQLTNAADFSEKPELVARRAVDRLRLRPGGEGQLRRLQDARRREGRRAAHELARPRRAAGVLAGRDED